jgi:outer membrane lipoprotein SlyB
MKRHRQHRLGGCSGRYYHSACHQAHSAMSDRTIVYGKLTSIKEHQNEGAERLMIGNVPEP